MDESHTQDDIDRFGISLLRAGFALTHLADDLAASLPAEAYPGDDPYQVVLDMIFGTIRSALQPLDPELVEQSTHLIERALDRIEEHLHLAAELAGRLQAGTPRGYG